jgi:hypothetical protein
MANQDKFAFVRMILEEPECTKTWKYDRFVSATMPKPAFKRLLHRTLLNVSDYFCVDQCKVWKRKMSANFAVVDS